MFSFEQGNYNLTNAFIRLKNGTLVRTYPYAKTFEIPEEFLFEGLLEIKVQKMKKGECVNLWSVLPIKIKYVEDVSNPYGDKVIYDYLYNLEERIKRLEEQLPKELFDDSVSSILDPIPSASVFDEEAEELSEEEETEEPNEEEEETTEETEETSEEGEDETTEITGEEPEEGEQE